MKKKALFVSALLLTVFISHSFAADLTLFGPEKYLRTSGKPNVYSDKFTGIKGQGRLIITNGEGTGKNRISSALVSLNGTQILGPSDFNQNVYKIEIPIDLLEQNSLYIELRSGPGGYFTVQATQIVEADTFNFFPTIEPSAITVGIDTPVTISVEIKNPSLIVRSVSLQRLDEAGNPTAKLGNLHDDGINGDTLADDKRFSIRRSFTESDIGKIKLLVSVFFNGTEHISLSQIFYLEISPLGIPNEIHPSNIDKIIVDSVTGSRMISNEVIVFFKDGVGYQTIQNIIDGINGKIVGRIPEFGSWQIEIPEAINVFQIKAVIETLKSYDEVDIAEPNFIGKLQTYDTYFGDQWGLDKIFAPSAWPLATTNGNNIIIGIIDTGINYNHEDLVGKVLNKDDLGSNFIQPNTSPMDDYGHGTMVAGIASAVTNNGKGIAGVSWNSKFLAIKSCDRYGNCLTLPVAKGISIAVDKGAKILNLSLSTDPSQNLTLAYEKARNKNVLMIASAGNENQSTRVLPAAYPKAISVGASDENNNRSIWDPLLGGSCFSNLFSFAASNYGNWVNIYAPGRNIYVLNNFSDHTINNSYLKLCGAGTSAAAPFVSGAAALVWSQNPYWSASQVRTALLETASPTAHFDPAGNEIRVLDIYAALQYQFTPYDTFSSGVVDTTKWLSHEFVREIRNGKLNMTVRATNGETSYNSLLFNLTNLNSIQTEMVIQDVAANGSYLYSRLVGDLYSDGTPGAGRTGNIGAAIVISTGPPPSIPYAYAEIYKCNDATCSSQRIIYYYYLGPVSLGSTNTLGFGWNGSVFYFRLNGTSSYIQGGPYSLVPYVSPARNPVVFTGVTKPSSFGEGSITALLDNVYVDGKLYDDFSGSRISSAKWESYEIVREINSSTLSTKMALFGNNVFFNSLSFAQPHMISSIQADVRINSFSVNNGSISARLGGRFYNSGNFSEGDIYAQIRIGGPGPTPIIYYLISRCPDNDCIVGTTIKNSKIMDYGNLQVPYTLFIGWDGSVFTFRVNGIQEQFDPRPYAPIINVAPNIPAKTIGNVTSGNGAGSSAYLDSAFDNVFINLE